MAKKNKKGNKISKKEIALAIYKRLDTVLADYQVIIGEKKFTNHLKKAAKILAEEVAETSKKQKAKLEKEAKKAVPKKSAKKNNKKKVAKPAKKRVLKKNSNREVTPETSLPAVETPETTNDVSQPASAE